MLFTGLELPPAVGFTPVHAIGRLPISGAGPARTQVVATLEALRILSTGPGWAKPFREPAENSVAPAWKAPFELRSDGIWSVLVVAGPESFRIMSRFIPELCPQSARIPAPLLEPSWPVNSQTRHSLISIVGLARAVLIAIRILRDRPRVRRQIGVRESCHLPA